MGNKIDDLYNLDGKNGKVTINHEWYGDQVIRGTFHIINDGERVGIKIGNHELFLWNYEVLDIKANKNFALIKGEFMRIKIEV